MWHKALSHQCRNFTCVLKHARRCSLVHFKAGHCPFTIREHITSGNNILFLRIISQKLGAAEIFHRKKPAPSLSISNQGPLVGHFYGGGIFPHVISGEVESIPRLWALKFKEAISTLFYLVSCQASPQSPYFLWSQGNNCTDYKTELKS